ncbi:hypothetical protein Tco_0477328 [Tanacetum coccineum]
MRTRSSLEYTIPRRRNRRRYRQQQEAISSVDKDSIPMADDRPMAEQLQAPTGGFETAAVGGFVQGNSGYPPSSVASYTRPPGFTQPNPQASRPNQGYNGNQGFEAYTKANDATLTNLQKNLNDFKREQNEFQNEQRNFQNMMLNMFQKQMGNNNASGSGTLPSNTIPNPKNEVKAITTRSGLAYDGPLPPPYVNPDNEDGKETEVTKDKSPHQFISPELSSAQVDNSLPSKEPSKKTHLPYPQRMKAQKQKEKNDMQLHKFLEMFQKLHFNISLAEALVLMPKYTQMIARSSSNKEKPFRSS